MDDAGPASIILKLFLLFILILINAFFAMSEIAIISLNDAKMEKMAEDGDKKAKQVLKLTKNSSNFLDHSDRRNPCRLPYFGCRGSELCGNADRRSCENICC